MYGQRSVMAPTAMVTSPHYLASTAGLRILQRGGNAVEAAIAAASTISVVYPHMNSLGGDNFWLIFHAKTGELKALNASGRAGRRCTIEFYRSKGYDRIPARGFLAANTVPGVVDGWWEAYQDAQQGMGSKLKWVELFDEAIHYAKDGCPVTPSQERWTKVNLDAGDDRFRHLQRFQGFCKTYLKSDGTPYRAGERFVQKDLAETLRRIAEGGRDAFYEGEIAERIVRYLNEHGGVLTEEDFADHRSDWVTPLRGTYRGLDVYQLPPPTQGLAALALLQILDHLDLKALGEETADYYHVIVEATKLAFADRDRWITDPSFVSIPTEKLLDRGYARGRAGEIDMKRAKPSYAPGDMAGDTIWLGVVDGAGNAVSLIQSIYFDFGSGVVAEGAGVLLQNRGSFFSLEPSHVNHLEPRKRTFHTLIPAMILKAGRPSLVYGTMGGEGQPQTQAALVSRIVDFEMGVQEAIEAPRWLYGRTWGMEMADLSVEGRISGDVIEELKRRGHPVKILEPWSETMGHAQAILIDHETGMKHGGADPRGDGIAVGY
ncbi:MAG: gamma-glutamyltransferase [candidate division NC10 bacterium]|nr:gamma-glutamyltransferase [candidate division NC10 bacterium]